MEQNQIIQGRLISAGDIAFIRTLIEQQSTWNRTQISRELCNVWNWRDQQGRIKDMACRTLLLKLHRQNIIQLPAPLRDYSKRHRPFAHEFFLREHHRTEINCDLKALYPLSIELISKRSENYPLWITFLKTYHYLGFNGTVGENMKYLIFDRSNRPLAALLFGSAAWKAKARDSFVGWDPTTRKVAIQATTNNMRFLILPWVRVPHLASHILSKVSKRIVKDWMDIYHHPIFMLETFVEQQRFKGTCYSAANWIYLGSTSGRSRNDRHHKPKVPIKDIWVYPLKPNFREELTNFKQFLS
jgi:Domain of unknown function (DUF4338)